MSQDIRDITGYTTRNNDWLLRV